MHGKGKKREVISTPWMVEIAIDGGKSWIKFSVGRWETSKNEEEEETEERSHKCEKKAENICFLYMISHYSSIFQARAIQRKTFAPIEWRWERVTFSVGPLEFFFFFLSFKSTATLHLLELFLSTNSISDGQEKLTPEINEAVFHHPNVDRVHQSISIKRLFQLEVGPELGSNCFKPI